MALLGANGSGKTTLLRILAALIKPDTGTVCIGGWDIERDAQQVRRLVGFVTHQPYLYDELTALENLLFFGRMYAVKRPRERAAELLQRVLALARALLHSPQLLLLDEPDTGLDEEGNALLETLLQEHIERGGTTLFTTHNLERALKLSDRIGMLGSGRVVYQQETGGLELGGVRQAYQEVLR